MMRILLPPLPEPAFGCLDVDEDRGRWVESRNGQPAYDADQMHAHAAAVSAADNAALRERVKVLEDALAGVLAFQSAPTQPTIHDWGRWRRILHARAALESAK